MGQSFGFSPAGYNQIVIFTDEGDFKKAVSANLGMAVIIQDSRQGAYVAGVVKREVRELDNKGHTPDSPDGEKESAWRRRFIHWTTHLIWDLEDKLDEHHKKCFGLGAFLFHFGSTFLALVLFKILFC